MEKKAAAAITGDFYEMLRDSALGQAINGLVYRDDTRPDGAATEDMVVKHLSGAASQVQEGVVVVNIYVRDVVTAGSGKPQADTARIEQLETLALQFCKDGGPSTEYDISPDTAPYHTKAERPAGWHIVVARLAYRRAS